MESSVRRRTAIRFGGSAFFLGLVPLLLLIGAGYSGRPESREPHPGQPQVYPAERSFRTVVVLLDSLPIELAFDSAWMPFVSTLRSSSLYGHEQACLAKATFPCMKSIFEGRAATTGTAFQDFSAVASRRTTWPGSLAALGLQVAAVSDHTLNRLYPGAFVRRVDYQTLPVPILERDRIGYQKTWEWLADPTLQALIIHIIGTDKVSHEFPVGSDIYRAKYLEADDFVRKVSEKLGPTDYLFVLSDHGHGEGGGHTLDAVYFARGPLFPPGQREDMSAEDMLFLLSAPYAMLMPRGYEGQIRMDLLSLPEDLRRRYLTEQAKLWKVSLGDDDANAGIQEKLNAFSAGQRQTSRWKETMRDIAVSAPWWLAAAFFLLSELWPPPSHERAARFFRGGRIALFVAGAALVASGYPWGPWLIAVSAVLRWAGRAKLWEIGGVVALLAGAIALALWFLPLNLRWIELHPHRVPGYLVFYILAVLAGLVISLVIHAASWRTHAERALWIAAASVWLLSYSGLYDYSLTRQGPRVALGMFGMAAILFHGGWRNLVSIYTLCALGLLPFIFSRTESFNIDYPWLEPIRRWPGSWEIVGAAFLCLVFVVVLHTALNRRLFSASGGSGAALLLAWAGLAHWFFGFPTVKVTGALLAAIALTGYLTLVRRAELPARWAALAGAVVLFVTTTFTFNGLQLSHVDFRFAADKIYLFREEVWRAPQLIAWSLVKYAFALVPAVAALRLLAPERRTPRQMLQFTWWRGLMVVLMGFGLALFDPRGLHELASEEIYFWGFLSVVGWVACAAWPPRPGHE